MPRTTNTKPKLDDRSVLLVFDQEENRVLSFDEIAELVGVPEDDHRKLKRCLKRIVMDGWLRRLKGRRWQLTKAQTSVIKVPAEKPEMGLFRRFGDALQVEALDSDRRSAAARPILIKRDETSDKLKDRSIVQYELLSPATRSRATFARILKVIGTQGGREAGIMKRILDQDLPIEFPDVVKDEASALKSEVSPKDHADRRDLRSLPLITIDGADAKDFDDAVYAKKTQGGFVLYVAIADVAHYVQPGSPLDEEAFHRGTSVYLSDRCIPMLPEKLSNGLCSLRPKVDRLCFVAEMKLDRSGRVLSSEFYRAVMNSHARFTYDQVADALSGSGDESCQALLPNLECLSQVASSLLKRRNARGSIDLDIPEAFIVFDEDGQPKDSCRRPRNSAHRLIEDLMLAANEAVARYMESIGRASLFRIHEDPDREKLQAFLDLASQLGLSLKLKKVPKPKDISKIIQEISSLPSSAALQMLILRSMAQARYAPENIGHFGLSADNYLHFTSPIRRYPDLVVHRLLADALAERKPVYRDGQLAEIAETCSTLERRAMGVERKCLDLDRAIVANQFVGETFDGVVTSVQEFGLFVAIQAPFVEGLVPISSMVFDYFVLDDLGASLVGEKTGLSFTLSQDVKVEIVRVDLELGRVEFRLVGDDLPEGESSFRGRRPRGRRSQGERTSRSSPRSKSSRNKPRKREERSDREPRKGGPRTSPKPRSRASGRSKTSKRGPRRK